MNTYKFPMGIEVQVWDTDTGREAQINNSEDLK